MELVIGSGSKPESSAQFSSEVNESVALSLPSPPRVQQYSIAKDKPRKVIRPPQKYQEVNLIAYALNEAKNFCSNEKPALYAEAISCNDSGRWMIAMQEEMESLHKISTWDFSL